MQTHHQNVFKFCPRCGSDQFMLRKNDSFICRNCSFAFYINAAAAVCALVVNQKQELLLTRRAKEPQKNLLDLPGGFVDLEESAEDALCRELKEELNLPLDSIRYLTSHANTYQYRGLTYHTLDLAFVCRADLQRELLLSDEIVDYQWLALDQIDFSQIGFDSVKFFIRFLSRQIEHSDRSNISNQPV